MLKSYKDFQKTITVMSGLNNGGITDYDLSEKVIDFQLWFNPLKEKYDAAMKAISLKYKVGDELIISPYGTYMSGPKDLYEKYISEIEEFLKKDIKDPLPISFERKEFKDSSVDAGIKTLMIDLGILS